MKNNFIQHNRNKMEDQQIKIWWTTWIHLVDPDKKQIDKLVDKYDLHEIIEQDFLDFTTQDKIDVYDGCLFLVMRFPKYNTKTKKHFANQMHAILWKNFIITVTSYVTNNIEKIQNQYREEIKEAEDDEKFKLSPYYILYKIIDAMYDKVLTSMTKFNQDLVKIEDTAMDEKSLTQETLSELLIKKRSAVLMKHIITPHSEILSELQTATMNFYEWDLDVYFEDLQYKTDKILSLVSIAYENTESLFDVSDTLTTIRTNKTISILTIFTVLLWILTWISGLYWMNVDLPAQHLFWVFWRLLGWMIWIAVLTMLYFKLKKRF